MASTRIDPPSQGKSSAVVMDSVTGEPSSRVGETRAEKTNAAEVKARYGKIINRRREEFGDVLAITRPRSKIDPIAEAALKILEEKVPGDLEKQVRTSIFEKGIASEVRKVTSRLNGRHMTDGRRRVLAVTYVSLLAKLIVDDRKKNEKLFADDLGVAEKIMLELEADNGPVDIFAALIVELVMKKNRITDSETLRLRERASQELRNAI